MNIIRIIIEDIPEGAEEEIIIRSNDVDEQIMKLIYTIKSGHDKLTGTDGDSISILDPKLIYYFEAVDNKVFAYYENQVFEVKMKLYEIEERFANTGFIRISKSVIVDIAKIKKLSPSFNSRFEALLKNGEKLMISRQYVPEIKKKLGIGG